MRIFFPILNRELLRAAEPFFQLNFIVFNCFRCTKSGMVDLSEAAESPPPANRTGTPPTMQTQPPELPRETQSSG
jgi:hypothetical protein